METKLDVTSEKAIQMAGDGKRGGLPFPLIVVIGALGAAAFFLLRRNDESDYEDYGEDAFRYESEEPSMSTAGSESHEYGSSGTQGNGATGMDYDSMNASSNTDTAI